MTIVSDAGIIWAMILALAAGFPFIKHVRKTNGVENLQ
jgi:hypothetical protein